jgi:hypothetical protein
MSVWTRCAATPDTGATRTACAGQNHKTDVSTLSGEPRKVGSFSALNGVAGAYAERLPVIFVASGYNTNDATASHLLHHSLGTHDLSYQYREVHARGFDDRRLNCPLADRNPS